MTYAPLYAATVLLFGILVAAWMSSPGHRANILGPYSQAGHGESADDRGTLYWCVDFAS